MVLNAIISYQNTTVEIVMLKEIEEQKMLEPVQEGKWSIREIIGHLHYWDKFILEEHIPNMKQGVTLTEFPDHDSYNREGIHYISRFDNMDALIDAFANTRNQLFEAINRMNDDVTFTIGKGKRQFTINSYIAIFSDHDYHHINQIKHKLSL